MIAMLTVAFTLLCALTAQVSAQSPAQAADAFNVSLGTPPKVFQYNQLLDLDYSGTISPCSQNCTNTQNLLSNTGGDPKQLCVDPVVQSLRDCEQCMFVNLINANKPMTDPRMGSTPAVQGFIATCKARANITNLDAKKYALALPTTWDGPTDIFVPTIGLVFTVGTGAFLGTSAIILLSNM
ncbi:hypothetical protein L218DRAFT_892093 [Marasmius fiardii PR-910]|nr:hypothetical protein L218DRAFT_892093 [Marasmius fiardii PR-910]